MYGSWSPLVLASNISFHGRKYSQYLYWVQAWSINYTLMNNKHVVSFKVCQIQAIICLAVHIKQRLQNCSNSSSVFLFQARRNSLCDLSFNYW